MNKLEIRRLYRPIRIRFRTEWLTREERVILEDIHQADALHTQKVDHIGHIEKQTDIKGGDIKINPQF